MLSQFNDACFRGLSDKLTIAIDTQNAEEVTAVLEEADAYFDGEQISIQQIADLYADARAAGYEF